MAGTEMTPTGVADIGNLTDGQIDALGLQELQDRVASAAKLHVFRNVENPLQLLRTNGAAESQPFNPATDWNDAMFAAERFGLFGGTSELNDDVYLLQQTKDAWHVCILLPGDNRMATVSEAQCGPLAICRAILKLVRDQRDRG